MVISKKEVVIPEYELLENGAHVDFVLRTTEEIELRNGGMQDVPHRHNYYTILFIKHGRGRHVIDFLNYDIVDKSIFFVSPGQVHQVLALPNTSGYVILFTKEFLLLHHIPESLIRNIGLFSNVSNIPPIEVCKSGLINLEEYIHQIDLLSRSEEHFAMDSISAWLKLFFIECNKYVLNMPNPSLDNGLRHKDLIGEFKLLLDANFSVWHKVLDYAVALNVSPDHLNNITRVSLGKTAKEFIQNRIVLEAKRFGIYSSLSSKEIAFKLGFDDPAHFSKFFKSISGNSFSDFRISLVSVPS